MTARNSAAPSPAPVPMLDVSRQNRQLQGEIRAAIAEVCDSGAFVHGPACKRFEASMAKYCGTKHAVGCASGSDALLLALMLYDIGPGDEVILPSFTFFATAGCVWRLGARPVFADILPGTFNMNPADVARKVTSATKAIMPVHLFGQCALMEPINRIAAEAGVPVIEDAAQAIGAEYRGRRAGALGTIGCFSFYPTKNLGGFGDGGMITTDDDQLAARLRVLRDHGQEPRYYHHVVGVNSRLDSLQAAVLDVKLTRLDQWAAGRIAHAERYAAEFARRAIGDQIIAPTVADACRCVWNQYTVRVRGGRRDALQQHLSERKIGSAIYYPVPLHLQECFAALGYKEGSLPVTEQAAREVLSLPVYAEMTDAEQQAVIDAIEGFCRAEKHALPRRAVA
jgi:dTDP-4-amino-4,6-dideoxygalactose transaminase